MPYFILLETLPYRFHECMSLVLGCDTVVGVETCYGLDGQGIESWWEQD
jgi:hypothetical protein